MAELKNADEIEAVYEMLRAARELERFGDLATNIAERVIYLETGSMEEVNIDPDGLGEILSQAQMIANPPGRRCLNGWAERRNTRGGTSGGGDESGVLGQLAIHLIPHRGMEDEVESTQ